MGAVARAGAGSVPGTGPGAGSDDHAAWTTCLDRLSADPFYAQYKSRASVLLDARVTGRYLEVGCGLGDDAIALASASRGCVIGLDRSRDMVRDARRRGLTHAAAGDVHALPFAQGAFDGCRADRVLQHVRDPRSAVAEMARVTRPGGRIVTIDPDYDTQVLAIRDRALARRILRYRCDQMLRNGALAHHVAGLFVSAGLREVMVETRTLVARDLQGAAGALDLRSWAEHARRRGHATAADVAAWADDLDNAVRKGTFLYAVTFFITSGSASA